MQAVAVVKGGIIPEPSEEGHGVPPAQNQLNRGSAVCRTFAPGLDDEARYVLEGGLLHRVTVSGSRVIFAPPRAAWTARRDFPVGPVMPYERRGTFTLMGRRRTPALKGV